MSTLVVFPSFFNFLVAWFWFVCFVCFFGVCGVGVGFLFVCFFFVIVVVGFLNIHTETSKSHVKIVACPVVWMGL